MSVLAPVMPGPTPPLKNAVAELEDSGTMPYKIAVAELEDSGTMPFKIAVEDRRIQARFRIKLPLRSRVEVLTLRFSSQVSTTHQAPHQGSVLPSSTAQTLPGPPTKKKSKHCYFFLSPRPSETELTYKLFLPCRKSDVLSVPLF